MCSILFPLQYRKYWSLRSIHAYSISTSASVRRRIVYASDSFFNLYIFHSNLIFKSPSSDTASGSENFASCSLQPKISTLYPLASLKFAFRISHW